MRWRSVNAPSELDRLRGAEARSKREIEHLRGLLSATEVRLQETERALRVSLGCLSSAEEELKRVKENRDELRVAVGAFIDALVQHVTENDDAN